MKVSKAWKEVFRRNLLNMEFRCLLLNSLMRHPLGQSQCPLNVSIMCFLCKITYKQYRITEIVKLNFSDFNIITLKPYVINFNHGYLMAGVSRRPFMQNETHHLTVKVCKADRCVTQNVCCVLA